MEKQIEEMAKLITEGARPAIEDAEALYNAGYRRASEVAMEMFKDFQSILFSIMYFGNDGKYHLRKMSADKVTLIFEKYYELKKKYTEGKNENA